MNKKRKAIWDKTAGKCFYCGCELPEKGWHADHFHNIGRDLEIRGNKIVSTNKSSRPELDNDDNLVPSCAPCNLFKSTYSIELMRQEIEAQYERIRSKSPGFRMLERMGLMSKSEKPVVFWFEKQGIKMPSLNEAMGISDQAQSIEWQHDLVDECYHTQINDRVVTLRFIQGKGWLCISTGGDWHQERLEMPNTRTEEAKVKAAQWALSIH